MKTGFLFVCLLFLGIGVFAQQKEITVFEKKEGEKTVLFARNIGKVPYLVTLNIHATGMNVVPGLKTETVVPAGYMKDLATLSPLPGEEWTYGYEVAYIQYTGESTTTQKDTTSNVAITTTNTKQTSPNTASATDKNEIVIYSKPGCSRCSFVRKNLTDKGIKFREVDVTSGVAEVNDMWMNLRHNGFSGESVTMPVVKVKGQYHYNIKDLQQFVNSVEK